MTGYPHRVEPLVNILFLARHFSYLRNYESVVFELARRGHAVHLAADREETYGGREMVERWVRTVPAITMGWTPDRAADDWFWLATRLRLAQDFLRYQDPRYETAPQLRRRAEERLPTLALGVFTVMGYRTRPGRALLAALLTALERAVPVSPAIAAYLRERQPDVMLVTPLVELGSPQNDHIRAAIRAEIPTGLCVGSWDHLSSKSRIRDVPDRIVVWNETQRLEAIELHGVAPARVEVTGAQCFDQWFDRSPRMSRAEFMTEQGLDPERPLIMWVCSSLFRGSPNESELVEEWLGRMRCEPNPVVREANVLVRPHPQRLDEWRAIDLSTDSRVRVRAEGFPGNDDGKALYFDALFHSAAVVGLNTSALIEAGVVGCHVLSLVDERYAHNQEGTLHWPYLTDVGGGVLRVARDLEEHVEQLTVALTTPAPDHDRFVKAFVRPHGLEVAATPRLADAVETISALRDAERVWAVNVAVSLRPLLYPLIWLRWLRTEWIFIRKRAKRDLKRKWQASRRAFRQGVKAVVLKRMRSEQPQTVLSKTQRQRLRGEKLFEKIEEVEEVKEILTRATRSGRLVFVGPWLSETGFELLYWIPFLHWAKSYSNIRDDRLIVISRGGSAAWYRHLTKNYHDVFDFFTPDEFRNRNESRIAEQRGQQKHVDLSAFDEEILDHVQRALGISRRDLIHPSLMYRLFRIFWRLQASVGLVQGYTIHRKMAPLPLGELRHQLPTDYIAVKFYTNQGLPDTPRNRAFISSYLAKLSAVHEVVLLDTGVRLDDHDDFSLRSLQRIHRVDHLMTPRNNLDVQTRIIGGARAFVGTYGGFSYLAPLCGVNTLALYSNPSGFRIDHLEIAKRVFTEIGAASFLPMHLRDLEVLRLTVGETAGVKLARS